MTVSVAVCDIFSVNEWTDLENSVLTRDKNRVKHSRAIQSKYEPRPRRSLIAVRQVARS